MADLLSLNTPLIGAEWIAATSLGRAAHINPHTGQAQAEVMVCGAPEVRRAASAAKAAQKTWLAMGQEARRDCLLRLASLVDAEAASFRTMAALECGTPVSLGGGVALALSWIRYYAGWADKIDGPAAEPHGTTGLTYVRHEPIGVVGVIIPWNAPLVAMAMTVVPALAAGNAVVLKPPTQAPFVALKFAALALEAGIPPGVLNVVPGDAEAGATLVAEEAIGKISFTGGGTVARAVMQTAALHLKPVALELGGKSANIVFNDADLAAASHMAAMQGVVVLSGQGCVLPTRIYAQSAIFDDFVARLQAIAESFAMGDPQVPANIIGPVINKAAHTRILGVIERARREAGGTLLTGGGTGGGALADGYYIEPTIFADVLHDSDLARAEVFGPVLAVVKFTDDADAVEMANDSVFGLGAYVHTNDLARAHRLAAQLQAGAVAVNGGLSMGPNMPFGGMKQSGFGREGGRAGLDEFTQVKQVLIHF